MTKYKLAFMRLEFVSSSHLHCLVDITLGSGTAELEREVSNSFSRIKSNFPQSPGLKVIFSRVSDKKRGSWNDKIKRNSHKIAQYAFQEERIFRPKKIQQYLYDINSSSAVFGSLEFWQQDFTKV